MKRFIIILTLCISFGASCSKEKVNDGSEKAGPVELTLNFGNTRTVVSGQGDILWESGDCVSIFDLQGNNKFTTTDSGSSASFTGSAFKVARYFVLYPYNSEAYYSDGVIRTTLPTRQQARTGSFGSGANIATTKLVLAEGSATMRNAAAYVKFDLNAQDSDVKSITIRSKSGKALSGKVNINISGENPVMTPQASGTTDSAAIASETKIASGTYYICVIPSGENTGIRLTVELENGSTRVWDFDQSFNLQRNSITDLGTILLTKEEEEDPSANPSSAYAAYGVNFSKLISTGHPRLFVNDSDFTFLKNSFADAEDIFATISAQAITIADGYAASANIPVYDFTSGSFLDQSRLALSQIFYCAYAYRMTGQKKYLDKARTVLGAVCAFPDWNVNGQFLDAAEMGMAVSIGYDWLYYELSFSERTAAHNALKNYLLVPFTTYEATIKSNWNQVCNAGALAAALVLYEYDKNIAAACIDKAIGSNLLGADYLYNPYGNGIEGYGYWDYAMAFQQAIISSLENAFGTSCGIADMNGLKKTGEWLLYVDGPTGPFNYSDVASETSSAKHMMLWLAARYGKPELMVREMRRIGATSEYSNHRMLPLSLIEYAKHPIQAQSAVYPSEKIWYASGDNSPIVLARLGWTYGSSDQFLGFKGCGGYNNHAHMDAGSFVYDAQGVRWASDLYFANYNQYNKVISNLFSLKQTSTRWDVLPLNNYFHNTLSFTYSNGSVTKLHTTDQIVGPNTDVKKIYNSASEGYGGTIDLTSYYRDAASSVCRTALLKDSELQIIDEIAAFATHSADFEWRMLTKATPYVDPDGKYIKLTASNGKVAYLYTQAIGGSSTAPVYDAELSFIRPSGWAAREWDSYTDYSKYHVVKFSSSVNKGSKVSYKTIITTNKP